jgi:hypothetical protein
MRTLAYMDSGAVSMLVSAVVAGFAGLAVVVKLGFRRFLAIFSPRQRAALREEQAAKEQREIALEEHNGAPEEVAATAPSSPVR